MLPPLTPANKGDRHLPMADHYHFIAGVDADGQPAFFQVDSSGKLIAAVTDPSTRAGRSMRAVTSSDSDVLPLGDTRALLVTVAGNVALVLADDTDAVTVPLAVGLWPFAVKQVKATGTTATVFAIY